MNLFNAFVRVTAYPVQLPVFRTKIYYENKNSQGRHIKGAAIVISNHTSVWDYAVWMFVFFSRTLRAQMAEVLFQTRARSVRCRLSRARHISACSAARR